MVGTGMDTMSAAYAQIVVYGYLLSRSVVTVFYRTCGNTGMAVYAFFLVYPDDRRQLLSHITPPINVNSILYPAFYDKVWCGKAITAPYEPRIGTF
jgi:hypothetical protein